MHVPHPDATGFMPRKNPSIQFVVSPGREIVQVTLWSDSSVDSRGEPRGLTRTQDHISAPQNPRSKLRCVTYCITILRSSQRATVVFPVLPLDQPYGLCSLSSLPPPRDVIWDFEAAFQNHLNGQSIVCPIGGTSLFTTTPQDSLAGPTCTGSCPT